MYLPGEEFEYLVDGVSEDFSCIDNIVYDEKDYIIAENEYGIKKVFLYDTIEEEIVLVDEDEEETVLDAYENDEYEKANSDDEYQIWDGSYDEFEDFDTDIENEDIEDTFIIEDIEDEEKEKKSSVIDDDFLDSIF